MNVNQMSERDLAVERLKCAAADLEAAANRAHDALNEIDGGGGDDGTHLARVEKRGGLVEAVIRMHDDEHLGPIRWCSRASCRIADELRGAL